MSGLEEKEVCMSLVSAPVGQIFSTELGGLVWLSLCLEDGFLNREGRV